MMVMMFRGYVSRWDVELYKGIVVVVVVVVVVEIGLR
jgi:hypothetical protein